MGIACRPISENLGVDGSSAASGRRFGLHNVDPRSLAQNKSIAVLRKWTRSLFRTVITRFGQDSHQTEARKNSRSEGRIYATCNDDIGTPVDHGITGVEQSVGGAGTAGRNHMTRAMGTKCHRDFAAEGADGRCGDGVNARLFRFSSKPVFVLPLGKFQTTTPAAEDDADPAP